MGPTARDRPTSSHPQEGNRYEFDHVEVDSDQGGSGRRYLEMRVWHDQRAVAHRLSRLREASVKVNDCAAEGCKEKVARHLLMCRRHWAMVPRTLQRDVYRTWTNGGVGDYLKARQAAIDSVRDQ
jgi:hypothetical protein